MDMEILMDNFQSTEAKLIGKILCGKTIIEASPARAGGNNRLFRLTTAEGQSFALKFYPPQEADPRDRLGTEFEALSFLSANGVRITPQPIAADRDRHCALYQWIEGCPPTAEARHIQAMADFLTGLLPLRETQGKEKIRPASAACLTLSAGLEQLEARLSRFKEVMGEAPELAVFISGPFETTRKKVTERARGELPKLSPPVPVLSPSDFGLHNALIQPSGQLIFLDFEYFGWDDPVKAVSDVMLHAGMDLPPELREVFLSRVAPAFARIDEGFARRLEVLYPLFGLIWCLIVLNEFLPERMARRAMAGRHAEAESARRNQLQRAIQRLKDIANHHAPL
jgi:hypothetical protein